MKKRTLALLLAAVLALTLVPAQGAERTPFAIAAGERHFVALLADGTCLAFGENGDGRCDVGAWRDVTAVAAGDRHTVALGKDGRAMACGDDSQGQLAVSQWRDLVAVAAGSAHTVGLKADGTVVATGRAEACGMADWRDVVAIHALGDHTVGLKADGTVVEHMRRTEEEDALAHMQGASAVWAGPDGSTVCLFPEGTADYRGSVESIMPIEYAMCNTCQPGVDRFVALDPCALTSWTDLVALAPGQLGLLGLKKDGTVVMAGENTCGLADCAQWTDMAALAVGGYFAVGVTRNGQLRYKGAMPGDMCGLAAWHGMAQVAAGQGVELSTFAVGLTQDGQLKTWSEQLDLERFYDNRVGVYDWTEITKLAASQHHTLGLRRDGTVLSTNGQGTLWQGIVDIAAGQDEEVLGLDDQVLDEGGGFTLGLRADGTVAAEGANGHGQLDAAQWTDITALAAGQGCALGIRRDGTVAYCGQKALAAAAEWQDIASLACGLRHAVGLKRDGTVVATGDNRYGQCNVEGWTDMVAVAAGPLHTVGLRADGACLAVGNNQLLLYGESPAGPHGGQLDVEQWTGVTAIFAGLCYTGGIRADGSLLLAGFDNVDLGLLEGRVLWPQGVAAQYPDPVPGARDRRVRARIAACAADLITCRATADKRDRRARTLAAAHPEYEQVYSFYKGLALFRQQGLYGLLDQAGAVVLPAQYDEIYRNDDNGMCVVYDAQGNLGFIDWTGVLRVPCRYDKSDGFQGDYARVGLGWRYGTDWEGYVDRDGNEYATRPSGGWDEEATAPPTLFPWQQGEGLWGYQDAQGRTVIPPIYDAAWGFEDGLANVYLGGCYGTIDEQGNVVSGLELDDWLAQGA